MILLCLFQVVVTDLESGVNINTMFGATDEDIAEAVVKVVKLFMHMYVVFVHALVFMSDIFFINMTAFLNEISGIPSLLS